MSKNRSDSLNRPDERKQTEPANIKILKDLPRLVPELVPTCPTAVPLPEWDTQLIANIKVTIQKHSEKRGNEKSVPQCGAVGTGFGSLICLTEIRVVNEQAT